MKKIRTLAIFNLLALLAHIALSYLTQFGWIGGLSVGEVSDLYPSLFTPAGITFAIWGVIYTALLFFCLYHLRAAFKHPAAHPANQTMRKLGVWFAMNNAGAVAWLLVWTHQMILASVVLIFFQLITLAVIHLKLGIHDPDSSIASRLFTQFPLSIYFGWLTIASVANTSIYLLASGWNGFGLAYTAVEWTRIMTGVVVLLSVLVIFSRKNVFFGLVITWGLYGIIVKRQSVDPFLYKDLVRTIWTGWGIVAASCILQFLLNLSSKKNPGAPDGLHHL